MIWRILSPVVLVFRLRRRRRRRRRRRGRRGRRGGGGDGGGRRRRRRRLRRTLASPCACDAVRAWCRVKLVVRAHLVLR